MKIAIGADHAGYELKEKLKDHLQKEGYEIVDSGATSYDPDDDYPRFAAAVARAVARGEAERGIVVCDSGIGVDIAANKVPGVRSALVHDEHLARLTREHNDSNVLSLGAMLLDEEKAKRITKAWLETEFSEAERHRRRVGEIEEMEKEMPR